MEVNYFWFARNLSQFLWIANLSHWAHGIVWCVCTMRLEIQAELTCLLFQSTNGVASTVLRSQVLPLDILGKIMQEK